MGALVMETLSTVFPKAHEKNLFRASLGRMPFGFRYGRALAMEPLRTVCSKRTYKHLFRAASGWRP